ncbi:16S rRNA (cytidine(1402)-2'-O)-methyltransferase [Candidatus Bipolaricaulota bacterium]|nr:16S rRNA (cytidine(1402)-2'-O)-methyltransferase [Candidatus Bipolaricaulota bacterium]
MPMNPGEVSPGKLFVVGTPIGNLADITHRAVETLRDVDAIVAEDSRHSRRILEHYDIDTPFTLSYYQGAGEDRREELIEKLLDGYDLALISDAGTPLISDPGFKLVREVRKKGIEVVGIPGPNAAITCLSISGQPTDSFTFDGQAPKKEGRKRKYFKQLRTRTGTTVIYDSPHRIETTLELLDETLSERSITLCRELTKEFEQTIKGTPAEVLESLGEDELKGEFTIVIRGATEEEAARARREEYEDVPIEDQYEGLKKLKGLSRKEAMKELARIRGVSKRDIYEKLNK